MTASKISLWFCLSFIGGIFISSALGFLPGSKEILLLPGLILGIFLISIFWPFGKLRASENRKKIVIIGFCILFLVSGIWRYQEAELNIANNEFNKFNDREEKISLVGILLEEPDIKAKSIKLTIKVESLDESKIKGKILITADRYPEYQYGDKLKIMGKLKTPSEDIDGFNYKNYLAKEGIYSVMDWPEIELIGQVPGSPIMKTLFSFKNKFKETARNFISPPQEGILEALIFGDESNISKEWKDKLNLTGTRHIAAVSGMNITILAFLVLNFLLSLGLWRQQAFSLSVLFLILYILMIGAPASAVRAGVMGILLIAAQGFGRLSSASRAVSFAAFLMILFNPLLLKFDVGFQLSFLAVLGMINLQPAFSDFLKKIPNPGFFPLRTTLSATLSAQVFTLPILIYNFGRISLISPFANILIVPFLAPLTILIFIFGIAGMIFQPLGLALSLPTWLFLAYVVGIVDWFSKIPFASLIIENINWFWLVIFYLILSFFIWRIKEKQKLKFLNY